MRKILALLLAAMLLLSLTACKDEGEVVIPTVGKTELVERTLDAIYVTDDTHHFVGEEYAAANSFESAVLNTDGTITLVMTGEKYNQILNDIAEALRQEIARTPTYDDCAHIKKIDYNNDFSEFTVQVVLKEFSAEDFAIEYLASCAALYRVLVCEDPTVTVITVDSNGTQLSVATYPQ